MFFLLRCVFWLGLVFSALPWNGDELRSDLAQQAQTATRAASEQAAAFCLRDPSACAGQAAALARAFASSPSQNTLLPGDLAPAWRGAAGRRAPG